MWYTTSVQNQKKNKVWPAARACFFWIVPVMGHLKILVFLPWQVFYLDTYYPLSKGILNAWDSASEWKQNSKLQFVLSKTYTSVMSIETPIQGQERSASCPPPFCEQADVKGDSRSHFLYCRLEQSGLTLQTVISSLRGGKGTWVWPGTSMCVNLEVVEKNNKSPHNLLPLLSKNAPLLHSPWEHYQIRSETGL